jgi:hypothetical protein
MDRRNQGGFKVKRKERKHQYLKLAKSLRSLSHAKGGVKKLTYAQQCAYWDSVSLLYLFNLL